MEKRKRRLRLTVILLFTLSFFAVAVPGLIVRFRWMDLSEATEGFFLVLSVALSFSAYRLRKVNRTTAEERLANDPRPPVLLLRSFDFDNSKTTPVLIGGVPYIDLEEVLVKMLAPYGPVIAIGRPGERSSPIGAARMYAAQDAWQSEVIRLLDKSAIVVLLVDYSEGIRWEIDRVMETCLHKTLFIPKLVILKRSWLIQAWALLPLIGSLSALGKLSIRHAKGRTFAKRGQLWYDYWNRLRAKYPILPVIDDRIACFSLRKQGELMLQYSKSLDPVDQVNAINAGLSESQRK